MPYLICQTYPTTGVQPTIFNVKVDAGTAVDSPAQKMLDNSVRIHYDISGVSTGNHNVTVKAVVVDPVWGRLESAAVPFSFAKPGTVADPTGIALEI